MNAFYIEQIGRGGKCVATISGMGRNKGTWDAAANSLRTAQRWIASLRKQNPRIKYRIQTGI